METNKCHLKEGHSSMQGTHGRIDQGTPWQMSGYNYFVFCVYYTHTVCH